MLSCIVCTPFVHWASCVVRNTSPKTAFVTLFVCCRSKTLEVLIGDTAILDYFRATDPGCNLKLLGDSIFDDAYAVGMEKAFPLKVI